MSITHLIKQEQIEHKYSFSILFYILKKPNTSHIFLSFLPDQNEINITMSLGVRLRIFLFLLRMELINLRAKTNICKAKNGSEPYIFLDELINLVY